MNPTWTTITLLNNNTTLATFSAPTEHELVQTLRDNIGPARNEKDAEFITHMLNLADTETTDRAKIETLASLIGDLKGGRAGLEVRWEDSLPDDVEAVSDTHFTVNGASIVKESWGWTVWDRWETPQDGSVGHGIFPTLDEAVNAARRLM